MKAAEVKEALARRHGSTSGSGEWVCIEEAFSGWASAGGGVDLLAVGVWRTAKCSGLEQAGRRHIPPGETEPEWDATNPIVAYEVKVSRSDMRRELYGYTPGPNARPGTRHVPPWPHKAFWALERSHYFMFAVPKGLLKPEEIARRKEPADAKGLWVPAEAGLIEVDGAGCRVVHPAPRRACPPRLSRHEVAELIRHVADPNAERSARALLARVTEQRERYARELGEAERKLESAAFQSPIKQGAAAPEGADR